MRRREKRFQCAFAQSRRGSARFRASRDGRVTREVAADATAPDGNAIKSHGHGILLRRPEGTISGGGERIRNGGDPEDERVAHTSGRRQERAHLSKVLSRGRGINPTLFSLSLFRSLASRVCGSPVEDVTIKVAGSRPLLRVMLTVLQTKEEENGRALAEIRGLSFPGSTGRFLGW